MADTVQSCVLITSAPYNFAGNNIVSKQNIGEKYSIQLKPARISEYGRERVSYSKSGQRWDQNAEIRFLRFKLGIFPVIGESRHGAASLSSVQKMSPTPTGDSRRQPSFNS